LGRWKRLDRLPSVVARQQHSHFFMEMEPRSPVRPEPGQQFAEINVQCHPDGKPATYPVSPHP
jgi:hypothetical protein